MLIFYLRRQHPWLASMAALVLLCFLLLQIGSPTPSVFAEIVSGIAFYCSLIGLTGLFITDTILLKTCCRDDASPNGFCAPLRLTLCPTLFSFAGYGIHAGMFRLLTAESPVFRDRYATVFPPLGLNDAEYGIVFPILAALSFLFLILFLNLQLCAVFSWSKGVSHPGRRAVLLFLLFYAADLILFLAFLLSDIPSPAGFAGDTKSSLYAGWICAELDAPLAALVPALAAFFLCAFRSLRIKRESNAMKRKTASHSASDKMNHSKEKKK